MRRGFDGNDDYPYGSTTGTVPYVVRAV